VGELVGPPARRQIHDELRTYLLARRRDETNVFEKTESLHFELAFGMEALREAADPASRTEPVPIDTPAGTVRVKGKIDRVDRVGFEDETGLLVVDYKTGRLPKFAESLDGRNAQMPLYVVAAREILGEPCLGGAFHSLREEPKKNSYFARITRDRGSLKTVENFDELHEQALARLGGFIEAMRAGRFVLRPSGKADQAEKTCRHCPYTQICRYAPTRAEHWGDEA
jgi:ATP-dependent helicase/nuclease subunit B